MLFMLKGLICEVRRVCTLLSYQYNTDDLAPDTSQATDVSPNLVNALDNVYRYGHLPCS